MLVLSRRPKDTVVLPEIGVSIDVLSVRGNTVKIGIAAPSDIHVLRGELALGNATSNRVSRTTRVVSRQEFHELKNRLNTIRLMLNLSRRQREAGLVAESNATVDRLIEQFGEFEGKLNSTEPTIGNRQACTALLVEDDANERELLAGILRMNGHSVITAGDGLEAMDLLRTESRPDVILLDMRMPRCDGRTMVRMIRSNPSYADLPIFAVSATEPQEMGIPTGAEGVNDWFAKPLNPELLASRIGRLNRETVPI